MRIDYMQNNLKMFAELPLEINLRIVEFCISDHSRISGVCRGARRVVAFYWQTRIIQAANIAQFRVAKSSELSKCGWREYMAVRFLVDVVLTIDTTDKWQIYRFIQKLFRRSQAELYLIASFASEDSGSCFAYVYWITSQWCLSSGSRLCEYDQMASLTQLIMVAISQWRCPHGCLNPADRDCVPFYKRWLQASNREHMIGIANHIDCVLRAAGDLIVWARFRLLEENPRYPETSPEMVSPRGSPLYPAPLR